MLTRWVPGSRDVINGLAVEPDEPDDDAEITDAVRMVLEKDPFVHAGKIRDLGVMRAAINCAFANRQIITHLTPRGLPPSVPRA